MIYILITMAEVQLSISPTLWILIHYCMDYF